MMIENPYDKRYSRKDFYWGKTPSIMCLKTLEFIKPDIDFCPRLLDLGCGEGRNAIYFAQNKFDVVALDLSPSGLNKTTTYAKDAGVSIKTIQANIVDYTLKDTYDVIFSTGTLQYLPPETRSKRFQNYKDCTSHNGINVLSVFVTKPFIPKAPDAEDTSYPYKSGELMHYYWDWEILFSVEEIFNCMSSGIPHKHAVNRIIARRYESSI